MDGFSYILLSCAFSTQIMAHRMASAETWTTQTLERLSSEAGDVADVVDALMSFTTRGNPLLLTCDEVERTHVRLGWQQERFRQALAQAVEDGWLGCVDWRPDGLSIELVRLA